MLRSWGMISAARVTSTAAQAVTVLLIARSLGPTEFGRFAAVLGGLTALSILADGGATHAVVRHHLAPTTIVQIMRAGRLLSGATLVVSVPVLVVLVHTSAVPAAWVLLCAWVPLERQAEVDGAYLLARGHEHLVGGTYLLRRVPTLAAVLAAPAGSSLVAVVAVTMVLTAAVAVAVMRRRLGAETARAPVGRGLRTTFTPKRTVWTLLRPFWVAMAGQGVRQADVAVLGIVAGADASGVFAPASRLVPALLLVPAVYTQLLLGQLSAGRQSLTTPTLLRAAVVATATFAPLAVLADRWVPLLLGEAYTASVPMIRVVVVSLVFATLSSVYASALHATDDSRWVATAVWTGVTVTIALVVALGAVYGAMGAAAAVATGYLVQLILMAAFHRSRGHQTAPSPAATQVVTPHQKG